MTENKQLSEKEVIIDFVETAIQIIDMDHEHIKKVLEIILNRLKSAEIKGINDAA